MLSNSLVYAGGAALLGTALGGLLAWIVARTNTPGKGLVELMPLYPLLMPPIMKNIAWILLLAPKSGILNGMLEQFLGITYPVFNAFSMLGMIWVFGIACVPLGYLFLLPVFLSFDQENKQHRGHQYRVGDRCCGGSRNQVVQPGEGFGFVVVRKGRAEPESLGGKKIVSLTRCENIVPNG